MKISDLTTLTMGYFVMGPSCRETLYTFWSQIMEKVLRET